MSLETATKSYHRLVAQGKKEEAEKIFSARPDLRPGFTKVVVEKPKKKGRFNVKR